MILPSFTVNLRENKSFKIISHIKINSSKYEFNSEKNPFLLHNLYFGVYYILFYELQQRYLFNKSKI